MGGAFLSSAQEWLTEIPSALLSTEKRRRRELRATGELQSPAIRNARRAGANRLR
jgi:hypothetical protein